MNYTHTDSLSLLEQFSLDAAVVGLKFAPRGKRHKELHIAAGRLANRLAMGSIRSIDAAQAALFAAADEAGLVADDPDGVERAIEHQLPKYARRAGWREPDALQHDPVETNVD